jgi:hypothetical protein
MSIAMNPQSIVILVAIPLILWRMYYRIKRLVGRQVSRRGRHLVTVVLFPLIALLLLFAARFAPIAVAALAGGACVGTGLALYGLRLTRFEKTTEGMFYTPNAHLGVALSMLMIGRILYRIFEIATTTAAQRSADADFARHPLTLVIFGMMVGYYVVYALGVLRWRAGKLKIGTHL